MGSVCGCDKEQLGGAGGGGMGSPRSWRRWASQAPSTLVTPSMLPGQHLEKTLQQSWHSTLPWNVS